MEFRKHVVAAVFKRNFVAYFSGPLGYLFIVVFVAVGSFLAFSEQFFANNLANLDRLNEFFPILLLFFVPALTMSSWAEERKLGTDELLFTLPGSDLEILLGKYLAVLGIYTVALGFSLSHVVVLSLLGSPDLGLMFATYFGYWVSGAALVSAGMVASILTPSATVAYVLGSLICLVPVYIDAIWPTSRLLQGLSVSEQFRDFGLGMVPLSGLLYFASLTVAMLYLNLVLISRRHWSGGPHGTQMGLHYAVRFVSFAVILISLNVLASNAKRSADLTSEKLFSLSPTTEEVISSLSAERPILVQAFISPQVPRELVSVRTSLLGLLRQFDQLGGSKVRVRIVSTEKFSEAAEEAKRYGIEPQEIQSEVGGRWVRDDVFLGVAVSGSLDDQVVIPFFDKGTPVEYELTRSLRTIGQASRKKLGVLRTDAQVAGGFDMQSFRSLPEWRIIQDLKKQYDVKQVSPDELTTTEDLDVLLAVMPSSLTDIEVAPLIEYIQRGKPTLIIDDPFPRFHLQLAPRNPKPRPGGPMGMGGGMPQQKADNGEAKKLCDALEIAWNSGETVWDQYDAHPEFRELFKGWSLLDVVYITPANRAKYAFSPTSGITRGLQEVMLFYPGTIKPRKGSELKFEPLMRSSDTSHTHDYDEIVTGGFFGISELKEPPDPGPSMHIKAPVIAAHITGKPASAGETKKNAEINVVFIADLDMISNEFFFIRDKEWQGLKLDNINFVLNAVDQLAGDDAFLDLRARRPQHRTLERVERLTKAFKEHESEEAARLERETKDKIDELSKRLQKEIDEIEARTDLDPRTKDIMARQKQAARERELEVFRASAENDKKKRLKRLKDETERDVRKIETQIRLMAIGFPPVPALVLGLIVFAGRLRAERLGIVPDRLVGKR